MASLMGRRVVVTGSGRGIGERIAAAMAAEGAAVVVTARTGDQVEQAAAKIRSAGGVAHAIVADIADDESVSRLAEDSERLLGGPIDTLVNNAGVYKAAKFMDHDLEDWNWVLGVNVVATVRVSKAFVPAMLELERSRVIFVASVAGKKGSYGQAAYNASKHAQIAITRCMAIEYGDTNLRVNAICPGFTMTDLIDADEIAAVHGTDADTWWSGVEAASTIGRTVRLGEIASLAVYLASPAADGMNGQSLAIDGGILYA
ncbi:MAG: SDR family oxidoreductase [Actinobacteria bacterium]|nr:SDR family oxidoreductase [Actinomycetota bacterium]